MRNILFTTITRLSADPVAGGELYLLDLMRGLAVRGVKPHLLFPSYAGRERLVLRIYDSETAFSEYELSGSTIEENFSYALQKFEIEIVHFQHFQLLPLSLMKKTKDLGKKLVLTIHDYFLWCKNFFLISGLQEPLPSFCFFEQDEKICAKCFGKSEAILKVIYGDLLSGYAPTAQSIKEKRESANELLGLADLIIAPTNFVRNSFLNLFPNLDPAHFVSIEHGLQRIQRQPPRSDSVHLNVAFLGGYKYEKGCQYFDELLKICDDDRLKFYIIGSQDLSVPRENKAGVVTLGKYRREELSGILLREKIDVVLLLSPWAETFSYTLSESVMNGIPVIATDCGAFRERISKHAVGFLVPLENPVNRTAELLKDMAQRRAIVDFFRRKCLLAAELMKDINTMATEYVEQYEKIAAR